MKNSDADWEAVQGDHNLQLELELELDLGDEEAETPEIQYIGDQSVTLDLPEQGWRTFTEEEVNDLFLYFSSKGHDFTQIQMMNEFGYSPRDWSRVKNHFNIYKKSNVFAPFSFELIPVEQREQAVTERLKVVFDNPNHVIDRSYTKALQQSLKKQLSDIARERAVEKNFLAELANEFSSSQTPEITQRVDFNSELDDLFVAVSDIHINSRVEGLKDTQDYNNEICAKYLDQVANAANAKKANEVTVLLNGDIIESVTGKNHPDVFTEMEHGSTYAKGIKNAVIILSEFLSKIVNLKNVLVISGNHDRLTSSNHEDATGGAAELIYEFLNVMLTSTEVIYHPKVLTHSTEHLNIICSHGDKLAKVKPEEIFFRYGSRDKFNFYLTGHYHNRSIKMDCKHGRHISLPSIFSGNTYSDHAGWSSDPGYVLIYTEFGKPVVEDRSL
jgi:predicted phosphodiesterase